MRSAGLRIFKRLNSPLGTAFITAVLVGLFIFGRLSLFGFDWSAFVVAGDRFCDPAKVPPGLTVLPNSDGYDGQFYYRLALNPFTDKATDFGVTLDTPPYRQQRILYSTLTSILSFGRTDFVPIVMVLINCICLCVLGGIGAAYAQTFQRAALWGLTLPLHPAFLFTLSRDLVEILEITLALGSLLLIRRARPIAATILLTLAVLTRETAIVIALAGFVVFALLFWRGRDKPLLPWYYFTIPVALFLLWQGVLYYNWAAPAIGGGSVLLGVPFVGPFTFLMEMAKLETSFQRQTFIELLFLLLFSVGVFLHLYRAKALRIEAIACLLYAVLAISLTRIVWIEDWGFFRAASQFCALGVLIMIASTSRMKAFVLGGSGLFWVYLAERLTRHYS